MSSNDNTSLFQPHGLLTNKDNLAISDVDLFPVFTFINHVLYSPFDLVQLIDGIANDISSTDTAEMKDVVADFNSMKDSTKSDAGELKSSCKDLKLRTLPVAMALCLDTAKYAQMAIKEYPNLFSAISSLAKDPTSSTIQDSVARAIADLQATISKIKSLAEFAATGCRDFDGTARGALTKVINTKDRLKADSDELMKKEPSSAEAGQAMTLFRNDVANLVDWLTITLPDPPIPVDLIHSLESMQGIWSGVGADLSSISSNLDATKLEAMNATVLALDQKVILHKWQVLADQCSTYLSSNLGAVEDEIQENLRNEKTRNVLTSNILASKDAFATPVQSTN